MYTTCMVCMCVCMCVCVHVRGVCVHVRGVCMCVCVNAVLELARFYLN